MNQQPQSTPEVDKAVGLFRDLLGALVIAFALGVILAALFFAQ